MSLKGSYSKRTSQVKEDVVQEGIETKGSQAVDATIAHRTEVESSSSNEEQGKDGRVQVGIETKGSQLAGMMTTQRSESEGSISMSKGSKQRVCMK